MTAAPMSRLSPMQHRQLAHETAKIAQTKTDADIPKDFAKGVDGKTSLVPVYTRDASGKLQLSPEYSKQACTNYNKMMASNQHISDINQFGGGGVASSGLLAMGVRGFLNSPPGMTVGTLASMVGNVTAALAHAPAPPGCVKQ